MLDIKDKIVSWCTAADVSGFVSAVRHPILAQKSVEVFELCFSLLSIHIYVPYSRGC